MCRVSWDDCVQPSEKGVRVKGTAGLIAPEGSYDTVSLYMTLTHRVRGHNSCLFSLCKLYFGSCFFLFLFFQVSGFIRAAEG